MTGRCVHSSVGAGFDSLESLFCWGFFFPEGGQELWQGGGRNVRDYLAFVFIAAPLVKR